MPKRRTKLARAPLSKLRGTRKIPYDYELMRESRELDLRKESNFREYLGLLKTGTEYLFSTSRFKELIDLASSCPRRIINGQVVIFVDRFRHPENARDPAHIVYGLIFVSSRIPKKWQRIIIKHETDELILRLAGYNCMGRRRSDHPIALRRERQALEKGGGLIPFLRWLKRHYPVSFEKRCKAWKIPMDSVK